MRLRRLDILGFKSFRSRTAVEIGDGVTAIVGPNGCGKSNLVDAIRWALGAQNARDLRGRDMADVIFAGSESHPPMGFAEVSLVFENDRLDLPHPWRDIPELRVTRRLHRSGESEYEINGVGCRLRDLTELFLGTGVGSREAYSIIEQGKVGFIVQARPEERRVLIEEAAGITRYRFQRRNAERRLEATRANLTRLHDIIGEVARQVAGLERQAQRAARWHELTARRRALEITAVVERHGRLAEEQATLQRSAREHDDARAAAMAVLGRADVELESARVEWFVAERRMTAATERDYEARARASLLSNNLVHLRREETETQSRLQRLDRERDEQLLQAERAAGESTTVDLELAALLASEAADAAALAAAESALRAAREERAAAAEANRTLATELTRLRGEQGAVHGRAESLRNELARLAHGAASAEATLEVHRADVAARLGATNAARAAHEAAAGVLAAAETAFEAARARENEAREAMAAAQRAEREAKTAREVIATRVAGLDRSLASGAGHAEGPRQILAAAQRGEIEGVLGPLARRLRVEPGTEAIVATALGEWLDAIVVADASALQAAGTWARTRRYGVRLLVLGETAVGPLRPGCVAAEAVPASIARRLSAVRVVDDVLLAVTGEEGLLVDALRGAREADGWVAVGSPAGGAGEQLLVLTRDLDAARAALAEAEQRCAEAAALRAGLDAALEAALHEREDARGALERARNHAGMSRASSDEAAARLRAVEAAAQRLLEDAGQVAVRRSAVEAELVGLVARQDALHREVTERQEEQASAASRAEAADRAETGLADRHGGHRAAHAASRERVRALRQTLERTRGAAAAARERAHRLGEERSAAAAHRDALAAAIERDEAASAEAERERVAANSAAASARETHDASGARLRMAEGAAASARAALEAATAAGRDVELRLERVGAAMMATEQGVFERFGVSLAHARGEAAPEGMTPAMHAELADVIERIERLGAVNPNAQEEHREAVERHDFLTVQQLDMEAAIADLVAAISRMDETSRELFVQTYEAVNARFQALFPRLFRGGRAHLELTHPDDLLETGIEIVCQPPGKRLQSLTLMSGGEKALSAVALIFAIFQMKPTPFCILDEVDAPLDEGNVVRFSDLVRELAASSQFLLITHNKRTMEAAGTLYGVTMEEPGVSRMVGVRLHGQQRGPEDGAPQPR